MSLNIAEVVSHFQNNWTKVLTPESIQEVCDNYGLNYRDRTLSPVKTIQIMLLQVLNGNTALTHLRHLTKLKFSAAAFCKSRMKIPSKLMESLLSRIVEKMKQDDFAEDTWNGHRVFIGDGSSCSMSDEAELANYFGYPSQPRKGCSFPVAKPVFQIHMATGMISKMLINVFHSHDHSSVKKLHTEFSEGDIYLCDRAFCSYHHLSLLIGRGVHALFRLHEGICVDFTPGREHAPTRIKKAYEGQPRSKQVKMLGRKDQIVIYYKPTQRRKSMTKEDFQHLPREITVRELQYEIREKGFRSKTITVVTTLLDAKIYTAEQLAQLYARRWEIETAFDHLKTTMKMDVLKCKTVEGIFRELYSYCIVYNLVRLVMIKAAKNQKVTINRISFIDALRWITHFDENKNIDKLIIIPNRPGRMEPRKKKRKPKPYLWIKRPRYIEKQALLKQTLSA